MSDCETPDQIRQKIRDGIYKIVEKEAKNEIWKIFYGIITYVDDQITELQYVQCRKCLKVLSYDRRKGGTSHLRRHADSCTGTGTPKHPMISQFFKIGAPPLAVKQEVAKQCAEFACRDIRPFEIISGEGFRDLAQRFINIGVKYGQVSAEDIIPHPTTVSRNVEHIVDDVKKNVVLPQIAACFGKGGGCGITTDMWTDAHTQTSYITVTVHYIAETWDLVERVLATREFDPDLRHTAVNIKQAVCVILEEFGIQIGKVTFVTDRGANMLAALKEFSHLSCCDHLINTILSHLFDIKEDDVTPKIKTLLIGSKELVKYFKKSGLMRHLPTTLKQEVNTRWNTMYNLLESVSKNYDQIVHILQTRDEMFRYRILPFVI